MLLTALETAKAIGAEQCSPMEETGQMLQPAKCTNSLGRAKMLFHTGLPTLRQPISTQVQAKGQTLCTDTKPQAHGVDFSQQPPSHSTSPHMLVHHLHTQHMKSEARNETQTPHQSWGTQEAPEFKMIHSCSSSPKASNLASPAHRHIPPDIRPWHCPMRWKKGSGKLAQKVWPGF